MIVIVKSEHLHFLVFSLAVLFTLLGWSLFHWQQNEHKAQAIRDYRNVVALERRLERFEQVAQLYRLKPYVADRGFTE